MTTDKTTKKEVGRPAFEFTAEMRAALKKLLAMQATDDEIAGFFEITRKTFFSCRKRDAVLDALYKNGKAAGKASLRRLMWQSAEGEKPEVLTDKFGQPIILVDKNGRQRVAMSEGREPNVTMQIWLSKNMLGMTDKQELTGKDGLPLESKPVFIVADLETKAAAEAIAKGGG